MAVLAAGQVQPAHDLRAPGGPEGKFELAADQAGAVTHGSPPHAVRAGGIVFQSGAVIFDPQDNLAVFLIETDANVFRAAVPHGVGDRFLGNAIEMQRDAAVKPLVMAGSPLRR